MSLVEQIEGQIKTLSPQELPEFRQWFAEYDWDVWDAQIEADSKNGQLDKLAEQATGSSEQQNQAAVNHYTTPSLWESN